MVRGWNACLAFTLITYCAAATSLQHCQAYDHDDQPPQDRSVSWPTAAYLPTPVPDRICLALSESPTTSLRVTWRTTLEVETSLVEYAVASGGPGFAKNATQITGKSQPFTSDLGKARYHEATLTNLKPNTKYLYRVGNGEIWSEWSQTKTASTEQQPFVFVYVGDAQNDIKSHWSRVVRNAFADAPRAAFFLHAGDLVNRGASDGEWGEWFYASGFIHRSIPVVATPGNHEMVSVETPTGTKRQLTSHWRPTFALPQNGPQGLEETCYYIDYQGMRLISLNSNEDQERQALWLEQTLSDSTATWNIVTCHHPTYSSAKGRDNQALRKLWQPIFDRHHVDLVLQGHDHTYARTQQLTYQDGSLPEINAALSNSRQQTPQGTVYVVSVSGPKMYDLEPQSYMRRWATQTQLYQVIQVEPQKLVYKAMTATGEPYDAFELVKQDETTRLVELLQPQKRDPPSTDTESQ